jgi:hypothetical protein
MADNFVPPKSWVAAPKSPKTQSAQSSTTIFNEGLTSAKYPTSMTHATPNISNLGVTLYLVNTQNLTNPNLFTAIELEKAGLIPSFIKALTVNNIQTSPTLSGVMYTYIFPPSAFKCVIGGYILRNEVIQEETTRWINGQLVTTKQAKNIQATPFSMLSYLATLVAASYYGALCMINVRNVLITTGPVINNSSSQQGQTVENDTTTDSMDLIGFLENVGFEFSDTENKIGKFELHFHCYP